MALSGRRPGSFESGPGPRLRLTPHQRRRRAWLKLEQLESRSLRTAISEFAIPTNNSGPATVVTGPDNAIWFTEFNTNKIGRLSIAGGTGTFSEFTVPTNNSQPNAIAPGPDGNLWFTESKGNAVGRITTGGAITEYPVPTNNALPTSIVAGPDGRLWFTEPGSGDIGAITTSGVITEYPTSGNTGPLDIAVGPDGALWFAESKTNSIGRMSTSGVLTEFTIPTANSFPTGITRGPDGAIWFTEYNAFKVGRITTSGAFTEYATSNAYGKPWEITTGPDGNLWFTANSNHIDAVGEITPAGVITMTPTPTAASVPESGAPGPNNTVIFAENGSSIIGVIPVADASAPVTGLTINATADQTFTGAVATFPNTDADATAADFTATINWGDGQTSAGTVTYNSATGLYTVSGSRDYAAQGTYALSIQVTDDDGVTVTGTGTAQVAPRQLVAQGTNPDPTEGVAFSGPVATFTDTNASDTAAAFTGTVTWGDGQSSAAAFAYDGVNNVWDVSGPHTYAEEGAYTASVALADVGGATASASSTVSVTDAPLSASGVNPHATEGAAFTGVVATFTDADPGAPASDFSAAITWGNGTASAGTVAYDGTNHDFTVTGTDTYASAGSYAVSVAIHDVGGASATAGSTAAVADAALTAAGTAITPTGGTPFTGVVATFTDADPGGTASYYTATINWGDGTSSAGTVAANGVGGFNVTGTHKYAGNGTFAVGVAIADAGGATATASGQAVVSFSLIEYPVAAGRNPLGITAGPDGALWFTEYTGNNVGRITTTGAVTEFPLGTAGSDPVGITASGGALWFAESGGAANAIGRITTAGVLSKYMLQSANNDPRNVTAGPDGNVWLSGQVNQTIESISPTGQIVSYATPSSPGTSYGITTGPDGNIWFTDVRGGSSAIDSYQPGVGSSSFNAYPISNPSAVAYAITSGPSGSLWFTEAGANKIGRITTSGVITEYTIPTANSVPHGITLGPDGALWFTESNTGKIGRITTAGVITEFATSSPASDPESITAGPNNTLWFTEYHSNLIGEIELGSPLAATAAAVNATEGAPFLGTVASFTDTGSVGNPAQYTATIQWGDGTSSPGTISFVSGATYNVTGSHTFGEEASRAFTVVVQSLSGYTASAQGTALVQDAALTAQGTTLVATEGNSFTGAVATFTDADPGGTATDYTATITWGDGQTSAGTIAYDAVNHDFVVTGTNTYADEGPYAVSVAIADAGGATASAASTAAVADAALTAQGKAVSATEGSPFSGVVATFTDANPLAPVGDFSATITWGDGQTSAGTVAYNAFSHVFRVTGTNTYADEGTYAVSVAIADVGGSTASAASTAAVADAALTAQGQAVSASEGSPFTGVVATFTDANPGAPVADFSATITWGDGQTSAGTVAYDGAAHDFTVTGTNTYADEGSYAVSVAIADVGGSTASASSTAAVADAALTAQGKAVSATEGNSFSGVVATFTDANPGAPVADFSATITWGDGQTSAGTVAYDGANHDFTVTGTNTYADEGSYAVSVAIADVGGSTASASSTAAVADAPLTAQGRAVSATEGSPFAGVVATFTDANPFAPVGDFSAMITWGDGQTSAGTVAYDGANHDFTVSGTNTYAEEGSYAVSVAIADVGGSTASASSTAAVADAALTAQGAAVSATEGNSFTGVVATFTDADPGGTVTDYTATITWGDGQTSAGTIAYDGINHDFTVTGTNTYAEEGPYAVSVAIADIGGSTASAGSTAAVADAPLTAEGEAVAAIEGNSFTGVVATFTDADPFAPVGDFSATITWGDGQTSAGTIAYDGAAHVYTVTGTNTYAEEGSYAVSVAIADIGGSTAGASSTATVADAPLTAQGAAVSATEGASFTGVVATFTDADPGGMASDYIATITWGDGQTSAGTIAYDGAHHDFTVTGTTTYANAGSYAVSVTIQDTGGATTAASTSTVADAPLTAQGTAVGATEGNSFTGVVATFTDADPGGTVTDYTATITWGDGQTSAGTIGYDGAHHDFTVTGTNLYADEGSYTVSVLINDIGGATTTVSTASTVADAPLTAQSQAVSATEGSPFTGVVATFTDADPGAPIGDYSATITWGDGQTSAGTIAYDGTNHVYTVTGTNTYAEEGPYAVSVLIRDVGGSTASTGSTAAVADAPLTAQGQAVAATEGNSFTGVVATFTDADPGGTVTDYTATITWGDGQSSAGTIAYDGTNHDFTVTGTNTYAEEGPYAVSVAIADIGGATASAGSTAAVADAPLTAQGQAVAAIEGNSFAGVVATFTDADPGAPIGDYSATITWGDGQTSAGTIAYDGVDHVYTVTGTNTYAEEGPYAVSVLIRDVGGSTASTGSTAAVADAALTAQGQAVAAIEGNSFTGVVATFTDADPNAPIGDYTATITWGDGQSSAGTIAYDGTNHDFTVSGTNTYAEEGPYAVSVAIADIGGATASAGSTAAVADAPLTAQGAVVSATEGAPFTGVVATFTDADPGGMVTDYTATITWGDGQTSAGTIGYDGANHDFTVTGSNTYANAGSYAVSVTIQDTGGATTAASTSTVADAPLTAQGAAVAATEGNSFTGVVATFTDADPGGTVTDYTATITWGDGTTSAGTIGYDGAHHDFTVTGTNLYAEEGSYAVSVQINDIGGATTTAGSTAAVADAPLTAQGQAVSATEGNSFAGVVATFTDADPNAPIGDYTATITWGDGQSSPGTIAYDPASGVFTVSGTNTYAEEGPYAVSVQINDVGGSTASASSVAAVADAALTAQGQAVTATEGSPFAGVVATFTDANPSAPVGDFTATITWGDGTTSAGTIAYDPASGVFSVSGSNLYADEGSYAVSVQINDLGGSTAVAASTATVGDAALAAQGRTVTATEGSPFTGVVATFTDANPSAPVGDFTATITWGDGTTSAGTISYDPASGAFTVTGTNIYADEGSYAVSVLINDVGGATASAGSTAAVADAALTAQGQAVTATEGSRFTGVVATFTDANPFALVGDFSATITWGDGQTSAGTIAFDPVGNVFTVSGSNTFHEEGPYTISVRVVDAGGATATAGGTVNVADASLSAQGKNLDATEGAPFAGVVATFTDANPFAPVGDFSATITWGDGRTSQGTIAYDPVARAYDVSGSNVYDEEGVYAVQVTVRDSGGASASVGSLAVVADAPLAVTGTTIAPVSGLPFTGVVATFTDPNLGATPGDFTATIDWGDGTTSAGTIAQVGPGQFTVSGTTIYPKAGVSVVGVTVHDAGGSVATAGTGVANVVSATLTATATPISAVVLARFQKALLDFQTSVPAETTRDFTATIAWGDGTSSAGAVVTDGMGGWNVIGSHVYRVAGDFAGLVTILDTTGASLQVVVPAAVITPPPATTGGNPVTVAPVVYLGPYPTTGSRPAPPPSQSPAPGQGGAISSGLPAEGIKKAGPPNPTSSADPVSPATPGKSSTTTGPTVKTGLPVVSPDALNPIVRAIEELSSEILNSAQVLGSLRAEFDARFARVEAAEVAIAKALTGDPPGTVVLYAKLDEMVKGMLGDWLQPEAVAIASGLAVSVGYVVWTQQSCYLLVSVVMASPLWRQFDPLAILDMEKEEVKGRRRRVRRGRDDSNPFLPMLDRGPHANAKRVVNTLGRGPSR